MRLNERTRRLTPPERTTRHGLPTRQHVGGNVSRDHAPVCGGSGLRTDLPLPSRGAHASFYEATDCQAPEYRSTVETGSRRSGLLMSQGARGGGASNNPDVRRGERRPRALGAPGDETPDRSRAARHPVNPSPRRRSRVLTGGPLESSFTRRLPSLRGHRRDGDAPAASMRWTEWASRSIYQTVPWISLSCMVVTWFRDSSEPQCRECCSSHDEPSGVPCGRNSSRHQARCSTCSHGK